MWAPLLKGCERDLRRSCEWQKQKWEVGGSEFVVRPLPTGNRFRLRWRLRCVRACVRASEAARARDASSVAGRGRVQFIGVGRLADIFRSSWSRAKTTPFFSFVCRSLLIPVTGAALAKSETQKRKRTPLTKLVMRKRMRMTKKKILKLRKSSQNRLHIRLKRGGRRDSPEKRSICCSRKAQQS